MIVAVHNLNPFHRANKLLSIFPFFPSDSRILDDILCAVCGDRSSGKHYDVFTCDGCSNFFKRNVRNPPMKPFVCRAGNRCAITLSERNDCRSCRMRKCWDVGMRADFMQSERGPRAITQQQNHEMFLKMAAAAAAAGAPLGFHAPTYGMYMPMPMPMQPTAMYAPMPMPTTYPYQVPHQPHPYTITDPRYWTSDPSKTPPTSVHTTTSTSNQSSPTTSAHTSPPRLHSYSTSMPPTPPDTRNVSPIQLMSSAGNSADSSPTTAMQPMNVDGYPDIFQQFRAMFESNARFACQYCEGLPMRDVQLLTMNGWRQMFVLGIGANGLFDGFRVAMERFSGSGQFCHFRAQIEMESSALNECLNMMRQLNVSADEYQAMRPLALFLITFEDPDAPSGSANLQNVSDARARYETCKKTLMMGLAEGRLGPLVTLLHAIRSVHDMTVEELFLRPTLGCRSAVAHICDILQE